MSGNWFSSYQAPNPQNTLLYNAPQVDQQAGKTQAIGLANQGADIQNQAGQQALADRAQLVSLAPGIAGGNRNALASALVLPGGPQAINALAQFDAAHANMIAPPPPGAEQGGGPPMPPVGFTPGSYAPGQSLFGSGAAPRSADANTDAAVRAAAQKIGLNPEFAARTAGAESGAFADPSRAVSPTGAVGAMQVLPSTAANPGYGLSPFNPHDPQQNISGGVAYLAALKQKYGNPVLASAAYNAGPGVVDDYLSGRRASLPPETSAYVGRVFGADGLHLIHEALAGAHGPVAGYAPHQQQVASLDGTAGMPTVTNDASGVGAPAAMGPPQNALAAPPQGFDQNRIVRTNNGLPYRQGAPAGFLYQYDQSNRPVLVRDPGYPILPDEKDVDGMHLTIDPITKQITSATRFANTGRNTSIPQPDGSVKVIDSQGHDLYQSAPNTRDIQIKDYERDQGQLEQLASASQQAQASQSRFLELNELASRLSTGPGATKLSEWQAIAQKYLSPALAAQFGADAANKDGNAPALAAVFNKLATQSAGQQERGVLGGRGGVQAIRLFKDANPSLEQLPDANIRNTVANLIGLQADIDYSNGAIQYGNDQAAKFRTGKSGDAGYQGLSNYDQTWNAQKNPQIYAAAMAAASGDDFGMWSKNLKSPADKFRVAQIIRNVLPNTQIAGPNGVKLSVSDPRLNPQPAGASNGR